MSAPADVSDDIRAAKEIRLPWWGVLCIIVGSLPIYLLFDQFGQLDIALPILNFILTLCFIFLSSESCDGTRGFGLSWQFIYRCFCCFRGPSDGYQR